jgi:hypothetical protein
LVAGLARAPGVAEGGLLDTEKDALKGIGVSEDTATTLTNISAMQVNPVSAVPYLLTQGWQHKGTWEEVVSARDTLGKVGFNGLNQATANVAALALGSEALGPIKAFSYLGKVGSAALRFGLSSASIEPASNEERFSNALQDLGLHTEFTDWLGANPQNQNVLEGKFKNAVDGALGGATADMVFNTAKYLWSVTRGAPDLAAKEAAQSAAESLVPEDARPTAMVTRTTQRPTDTESSPSTGGAVRFWVKPQGTADATFREVGSMGREDLQRFYDQVAAYAGKPANDLDVTEEAAPELHQGIGQFKISTFQSPDDVAPFMRGLLDNAPAIERPMSDKELNAVVADASKAMGLDPNVTQAFLSDFATQAKPLPVAVGVARTQWANIVGKISQNAQQGVAGLTNDEVQQHLSDLVTGRNWAAHILDIKAGLGRGLRAFQLPVANDYMAAFGKPEAEEMIPRAMGAQPPLPRNLKELQDFYELWKATGGDPRAASDLLQGTNVVPDSWQYLRSSFPNFYTGSILAGKAIVKGYVMPAFLSMVRTVEKTSGGFIASLNPLLDDTSRQQLRSIAANSPRAYYQTMGDVAAAWRFALQSMKQGGTSIIGGGYSAKDAAQRLGPITGQMLNAANAKPNWQYELGNLVNLWPRQVFSLVGGHDEFTKRLSYLGETRIQAMADAARQGLRGDAAQEFVTQRLEAAVDQSGAATSPTILNRAARSSLVNSTETGPLAGLIRQIDNWRNTIPELRYILPVFDVPANGLGEAIRRIPILSYTFKETRDDLLGNNGAVAQAEAYGRWLVGGSTLLTGMGLARSGLLTGAGPTNARARQTWLLDHQPYSINVPGVGWVSYKDYEPVGGVLGIMGEMYDRSVYLADDKGWQNHVFAAVGGLAEYMKDKAALQQLSDLLDFGGSPNASRATVGHLMGSTASGFVPAFIKYIRNLDDPIARDKHPDAGHPISTAIRYIMDALPGTSQKLDPMRNVMGEPIHVPNDTLLENIAPITIAPTNPNNEDTVTHELDRIYELTGYAGGVTPQASLLHGYEDARRLKLEDGRSLYDHFMDARQDKVLDGQNVRTALAALFRSDDYRGATYGSPTAAADADGNPSKVKMVSDLFRQANDAAKTQVATTSPIARRYLAAAAIKRSSPDLLGGKTLDEVANGGELLKSLGIHIEDFEDAAQGQ